jgi:nucleotide-binding universal stress UspA family protein
MTYVDLLLHIDTYPTPTPAAAIDEAVAVAASLEGKLTGLAVEVEFPVRSNRLADYLIGLSALADAEEARSRAACQVGLAHFTQVATAAGVFQATLSKKVNHYAVPDKVAALARTYDLSILPMVGGFDGQTEVADSVVFNSGRPVLVYHVGQAAGLARGPDLVVVAWDGSRSAARAMADALPVLTRAKRVQVLTVLNEKPHTVSNLGEDAKRHLEMHDVSATLEEVDAGGDKIGSVFDRYIMAHKPDLLVMGGYGHSRAREFLLGGATEHVLRDPPCPVLLSH